MRICRVDMLEKTVLKIACVMLCMLCTAAFVEGSGRDTRSQRLSGPQVDAGRLEKKIHALINRERKKKGLPALLWDERLHRIAGKYSRDMEQRDFFAHTDPDGRTFCDRYKAARYDCRIRTGDTICLGAENISQDNLPAVIDGGTEDRIAESVVRRWISSRGHRTNILTPYFKRQGIGVALSEDGRVYVTENFC